MKNIDNFPLIGIQMQDSQQISEGLKIACLYQTIAISFNTSESWDTPILDLIYIHDDDDNGKFEQVVSVNHASKAGHIDSHKEWFSYLHSKKLISIDWDPSDIFFPNLDFSHFLLKHKKS